MFDLAAMMGDALPYEKAHERIAPGDLLLLHHEFTPSWYGCQIEAVQRFTGPFAHIGVFDKIAGRNVVYESVVPKVRVVRASVTAEHGFFWLEMHRPMTEAERERWWTEIGVNDYSKAGAMAAGMSDTLGPEEDEQPRRWCAKSVALCRRLSGVDLGNRYVPTDMALQALNRGGVLRYVAM
jgi:hypothetical protein